MDYYDFGYGDPEEFQGNWYTNNDDSWFWDSIGIDPTTTSSWSNEDSPSNAQILQQIGYEEPGIVSTITKMLQSAGPKAMNFLKNQYTKDGKTDWRAVAATAGGLYGAFQSQQAQPKAGYQGGIPKYEAVREAVPQTFDPDRRPGSGGQRYFSQTQFAAPGEAATAARTAAREEVAGLESLNRANPAKQRRASPTSEAAQKGAESAKVREGTAASKVIETTPVPKYATGGILALAKGGEPRYLGGATDGMADKIPARIDGKQEARLSHGEFVISADVVSALGEGNSEAGAKRLYDMMDRIRQAAHGRKKQINPVNPKKVLPA